ncbi:B3 domain-containing protein REM10 [Nicotiana tabacum]|uniref:B3 domain-containing protein REM10 n=2 Tax=Nicotiana TaxID=4085 RepID=A0A1S3ZJZ8_TOBAC|nr:PREDICTED: B3 domain-containing protein REM14-like [Nicotiana sylvestris]XP_016464850.1 PREDICTED: B3 domain-containing protein REM14-like [Nicotiana tabacum]
MKIPPKKPHFFKPILPGFKNGLKIPVGFLKYLKGHDHIENAILRRDGKKWLVKLNDYRFEAGWSDFAEHHDLQLGDMLVFRHEGNMEFEVVIFDSSHCDREYVEYLQQQEEANNVEFKGATNIRKKPSNMIPLNAQVSTPTSGDDDPPYFVAIIKPYCISKPVLYFPRHFAKSSGLMNRKCEMILKDEAQRSWSVRLGPLAGRRHFGITSGWAKFRAAKGLQVGDAYKFELIKNEKIPIAHFHCRYSGIGEEH